MRLLSVLIFQSLKKDYQSQKTISTRAEWKQKHSILANLAISDFQMITAIAMSCSKFKPNVIGSLLRKKISVLDGKVCHI